MYPVLIWPDVMSDDITDLLGDTGFRFYVGIWQVAERSACFELNFGELRRKIFPGRRDVSDEMLQEYYRILREQYKVFEYRAEGKIIGWIRAYHKRQTIANPPPPKLPLPAWVMYQDYNEPGENRRDRYRYVVLPYDFTQDPPRCPPEGDIVAYLAKIRTEMMKKRRGKMKGGRDLDG